MAITELMTAYPRASIIVLGAVVTFISTLVTKWLTNQEHLKELKARQKELQKEMKEHKGDPKLLEEMQMEILQITGKMMKSQFKPLIVTFVPFILLFMWVRGIFTEILGGWWIAWYIGASLVFSMIFRKLLKMA